MWYHWQWFFALSFLAALLLANFVTPVVLWDEMRVKHTWNSVPANWESLGNATAGAIINLHIALKSDQESALIDTLYEVSNPRHSRYGAYLSKEEVAELVNPHPDTLDLVRAWLSHHGVRPCSISTTHGGSWLTVTDVLVSQANQLLGASYQLYRNSKTNDTIIRTVGYALPEVLHTHIRTIAPTTHFPSKQGMLRTPLRRSLKTGQVHAPSEKVVTARQISDPDITPSFLHWLYKTYVYTPSATPGLNKLGILGIEGDYPRMLDLTVFMAKYQSESMDARFTVVPWNGGGYDARHPGDVASIGVQYATAMGYPTQVIFYSIGGDTEWDSKGQPIAGDMYLKWLNNLLMQKSPPLTISISYGEYEQDLPIDYARALCTLFAELGVRGVTVLAASGKDGVGAGNCLNDEGNVRFIPEFPSTCPYVTSVGGTRNFRPEMAANLSGGGFSWYFETPDYQRGAVIDYLLLYPEFYDGLYNRNGRGYPDISAQAIDYEVVINGEKLYADGTACAVSTVAGIISLGNDLFTSRRRHPFGFLNPWLYSYGLSGIKDIQFGGNPGCNTDGFAAAEGWDPATGLGTLNFAGIQKIFLDQWDDETSSDEGDWDDHY